MRRAYLSWLPLLVANKEEAPPTLGHAEIRGVQQLLRQIVPQLLQTLEQAAISRPTSHAADSLHHYPPRCQRIREASSRSTGPTARLTALGSTSSRGPRKNFA